LLGAEAAGGFAWGPGCFDPRSELRERDEGRWWGVKGMSLKRWGRQRGSMTEPWRLGGVGMDCLAKAADMAA